MARIAGVDVPRDKRIEIALTYIYGIGLTTSKRLLQLAAISPDTRTKDLTDAQVGKLRDLIAKQLQGPTAVCNGLSSDASFGAAAYLAPYIYVPCSNGLFAYKQTGNTFAAAWNLQWEDELDPEDSYTVPEAIVLAARVRGWL